MVKRETFNFDSTGRLLVDAKPTVKSSLLNQYGTATGIPGNIEMDVINYTVPVGKTLYFRAYTSGGNADGLFKLKINGTIINTMRNSAAMRSVVVAIWEDGLEIPVNSGGTVKLTVIHNEINLMNFEGTILGFLE